MVFNTAETLVTYAPNAAKPSALLAAALPAVSADGLTYTFQLRTGVKFQDGTDMDAAAVKFSLERAKAFGDRDSETRGVVAVEFPPGRDPAPVAAGDTLVACHLYPEAAMSGTG